MAARKKMKKASKGKSGCLKSNGRLKKGFKWAKSRRGYCVSVAPKKKSTRKKSTRKSRARKSPASIMDAMSILDVGGREAAKYAARQQYEAGGGI